ncbi:hypothetical protein F52700_716 [Fusarium sp. NRRL 52700]|nr:hypothetical protein F52700_716 [Fusarium sp. NRRL 52700]
MSLTRQKEAPEVKRTLRRRYPTLYEASEELNRRTTPISASHSSNSNLQPLPCTRRALAARSTIHTPSAQEFLRQSSPADRTRVIQQHLIDHNILPPGYEYPNGHEPSESDNIDEIRQALERPRASLCPSLFSKDDFKRFKRADDHATKESRVTASVMPIIEGDPGDTSCIASDISFTNLDHLSLHKEVRRALDNHIVPSTQDDLPVLPNNFVEVKGPDGSLSVATRQALYDVTLGTRGFQSLLSYGATEPHYDNKAYALAWTYHGGTLKAYASHVLEPSTPEAPPGYAMTQIKGWSLTSDLETFRQGATAYRNGRDWAKKKRDEAIAEANKKVADIEVTGIPNNVARQMPQGDTPDTKSYDKTNVPYALRYEETSEDELSLDFECPQKRSCSPEKPASATILGQEQVNLDQQSNDGVPASRPNAFRDGRRFKLILTKQTQDKENDGAKEA